MASPDWPATVELRALLDALLDEAPSGRARTAIVRALALLTTHELVPTSILGAASSARPAAQPKEPAA